MPVKPILTGPGQVAAWPSDVRRLTKNREKAACFPLFSAAFSEKTRLRCNTAPAARKRWWNGAYVAPTNQKFLNPFL